MFLHRYKIQKQSIYGTYELCSTMFLHRYKIKTNPKISITNFAALRLHRYKISNRFELNIDNFAILWFYIDTNSESRTYI